MVYRHVRKRTMVSRVRCGSPLRLNKATRPTAAATFLTTLLIDTAAQPQQPPGKGLQVHLARPKKQPHALQVEVVGRFARRDDIPLERASHQVIARALLDSDTEDAVEFLKTN
ncbi:hypothetical protein NW757_005000 [Fusarium falciforme]|nr:hypothetical protein NW757_005000 [Fusarium falciforme]